VKKTSSASVWVERTGGFASVLSVSRVQDDLARRELYVMDVFRTRGEFSRFNSAQELRGLGQCLPELAAPLGKPSLLVDQAELYPKGQLIPRLRLVKLSKTLQAVVVRRQSSLNFATKIYRLVSHCRPR
jgi:hypothetical protein